MIVRNAGFAAALLAAASAIAQAPVPRAVQTELDAAWTAAKKDGVRGPATVRLIDQASIKLAPNEVFIPAAPANRIMTAMGNAASPGRQGLVLSTRPGANWLIDLDWTKEGYVRDGEAKDWQPDALLANLKASTERDNANRVARGIPALDITGWVEQPAYDARAHRLVWSLAARDRGAAATVPQSVNYNTYALGREGYFSLDLLTDTTAIGADKQAARDLLGTLDFVPGKRYADFNGSTDKVAEYGIAALVGAVAVKKLGLLALAGAFLLKAWKLALIAIAGGGAAVRRLFGRKNAGEDA